VGFWLAGKPFWHWAVAMRPARLDFLWLCFAVALELGTVIGAGIWLAQ